MIIPAMTDPLGKHWSQPDRSEIKIYGGEAIMERKAFDALKEYSTSTPTGVYEGKMWKCRHRGKWWLRWYWQDMNGEYWIGLREIVLMGTVDISEAGLRQWVRIAIYNIAIECETIRMCWMIEGLQTNGGTYSDNLADYGL